MNQVLLSVFCITLFAAELIYFRLASHFNIVDRPNHRSSHNTVTIRGGGIIFCLGALLQPMFSRSEYPYFLLGLVLISFISFMDDIKPVSNKLRLFIHLLCVALLFYQCDLFKLPFLWLFLALFFVIGTINAINFMDGINGITGAYSLTILISLFYINTVHEFVSREILTVTIISLLIFSYFNFRSRAKCFAGDVGSVGIAFIISFLLLKLILKTENLNYILLLLIYGLDTITTIVFRVIRKEHILDAHRSHFYQYLANERKMPHLLVSSSYALAQFGVNLFVVFLMPHSFFVLCITLLFSGLIFLVIRFSSEGSVKLLGA